MSEEFECWLKNDDALEVLRSLPDNSVDLCLTDPPYGTTNIKWDQLLDFSEVWKELARIMKPDSNIILFGSQPFTSHVILSNAEWFKYELVWNKNKCGSPGLAKKRPMKVHENIMVFANSSKATYNPIMEEGAKYERNCKSEHGYGSGINTHNYGFGNSKIMSSKNDGTRYPKSILHASRNFSAQQTVHPTQKPTNLLSWLIMTYSNPGEVVLDFTMGSGSTGVAAKLTGRKFFGIEKEKEYYDIAKRRISLASFAPVSRGDFQLTTQYPDSSLISKMIADFLRTVPDEKHEDAFHSEIKVIREREKQLRIQIKEDLQATQEGWEELNPAAKKRLIEETYNNLENK
jgi:site-specific DNA-methyltransferase (adenine-specific)